MKIKKVVKTCLALLLASSFAITTARANTIKLLQDTVTCSTNIASNGLTFTAYTRSIDSMDDTRVESTAKYKKSNGSGTEWYYAVKDPSNLNYALISRQGLPSGGSYWYQVTSNHYVNNNLVLGVTRDSYPD